MRSSDVCSRSEEHTSELQSHDNLVCRLLLEKKTNDAIPAARADAAAGTVEAVVAEARRALKLGGLSPTARRARRLAAISLYCSFFLKERAPPEFSPFPLPALLPI